jgi:hypothetical protein
MRKSTGAATVGSRIPLVVVEPHQHALEHIHDVLRRRRLLTKDICMLHFDAHSDLACPIDLPAALCFQPRRASDGMNLYEQLDLSSSGIAEWILPLVLAASLRHVEWVRPSNQPFEQLPGGDHSFHVGVWIPNNEREGLPALSSFVDLPDSARLRVDWKTAYYSEDHSGNSSVNTDELVLKQNVSLRVTEIPSQLTETLLVDAEHWILDVCLDYFCSMNPFLSDLNVMSSDFTCALNEIFFSSRLWSRDETSSLDSLAFKRALSGCLHILEVNHADNSLLGPSYTNLQAYFHSPSQLHALLSSIITCLRNYPGDKNQLIAVALDAIPHWTMPHCYEVPSKEELLNSIRDMCQRIQQQRNPPFLITIARSTNDGFTPGGLVDWLQQQVLQAVHSLWSCDCARTTFLPQRNDNSLPIPCRLEIMFDYGEWEGSELKM